MREVLALILGLSLVLVSPERILAQHVDLIGGTFDDVSVWELTLDEVTERLGRPSAVESMASIEFLGPQLKYHPNGLSFSFNPGDRGQQTVMAVTVRLSRSWDEQAAAGYESFAGDLHPDASANRSADRVMDAVSAWDPEEVTPEMRELELQDLPTGVRTAPMHAVRVALGRHRLTFIHEPETRLLEFVTLRCEEGS